MCGIVAILNSGSGSGSGSETVHLLLNVLKRLQNRGYDSAGICTITDDTCETVVRKFASEDTLSALVKLTSIQQVFTNSSIGIGHTRWATHGGKTDANSHPHVSNDGVFIIVHNGIIENFHSLKTFLLEKGFTFASETDSEVICNLLSFHYDTPDVFEETSATQTVYDAIRKTTDMLQGTWGLCILCTDTPQSLYCTRNGSPVLIGLTETYAMVVSEQSGFEDDVVKYIVLNNYDICTISKKPHEEAGISIQTTHAYKMKNIATTPFSTHLPYPHWTLKEIHEQRESSLRAISFGGRLLSDNSVKLGGLDSHLELLMNVENLILLGCGTSYHAGMCGLHYFKDLCNFNCVQLFDGADFSLADVPKRGGGGKTALLLLSQSGETKDLHRCIAIAKKHNLITIGIINVVDSLIAREVDCGCYLNAGREVAVASTKSFTSQCILLSMVAIWFSQIHDINDVKRHQYVEDLKQLSKDMDILLSDLEANVDEVLPLFSDQDNCFVLGKGDCEPVAREGSLKIKEISYIHSESYSTSSLKHGPFAILRRAFPVILIAPEDEHLTKNVNAFHEMQARYASLLVITNKGQKEKGGGGENAFVCSSSSSSSSSSNETPRVLYIPFNKTYNNILAAIVCQMVAYSLSIRRGINPDMPKNLAKVVTVE